MTLEYYESELFIWDSVLGRVEKGLESILQSWRQKQKIEPFAIAWPAETVYDKRGIPIEDPVLMDLPPDRRAWKGMMIDFVKATKPYALLLGEQRSEDVVVIVESHHGTRSWIYPIETHGRERVLGKPKTRDDVDCIGVLWRSKKSRA